MAYLRKRTTILAETALDYEEGTWTPGASTGTVTPNSRWYRKMGSMVWVGASVAFSSSTATGEQRITNIPFTPVTYSAGYVGFTTWGSTDEPQMMIMVWNSLDYANIYKTYGAALTPANVSSSRIDFTIGLNISGPFV